MFRSQRLKQQEQRERQREQQLERERLEMAEQRKYPDFLVPGTDIWIGCKTHTVQPGETLEEVARIYGVPVDFVCYSNFITYVAPLTVIEWP